MRLIRSFVVATLLGWVLSSPGVSMAATYNCPPNYNQSVEGGAGDDVVVANDATCGGIDITSAVVNSVSIGNGATVNSSVANINGWSIAVGVDFGGGVGTLTNNGTINGGSDFGLVANRYIGNVNNNLTGNINGFYGVFVWSSGDAPHDYYGIGTFNNYGRISGTQYGIYFQDGGYIGRVGTINNFESGYIAGSYTGIQLNANSRIDVLNNSGVISGDYGISNTGTIDSLSNSGVISGATHAILQEGTIGTLSNSGAITGSIYGLNVSASGSVDTLTNYGVISGDRAAIFNGGSIGTFNNAQSALTFSGNLPSTYQIILGSSASTYGSLILSGGYGNLDRFGIYAGSIYAKKYSGVLSGITDVTNGKTGTYLGQTYQLVLENGSSDIWDLLFPNWYDGPNAANTLQSVQQIASGMSSVYNQQAAAYQAALSYDCQVYDQNNLCVSVGGRYTYAGPSPSANQQAGLVILGYKPVPTFRLGAFADQSVNNTTPTGITQSKSSPMWGLFAKWHMNKDETGLGVQASAVTSASKLTTTRAQLEDTEAGTGSTQFNGQGYQLTTNYHQPVTDNTSLVPYLGLRYTRINAGAYTENITATVTSPLSYNAMAQNTFSAIAGLGVRSHLAEKLTGTASVGIQQNLNYSMGNYAGTSSISGLETFSVQMPGNVNSMATASAGLYYDVRKNERVGFNVLWQQQPFIATNTTTALATYTIGF